MNLSIASVNTPPTFDEDWMDELNWLHAADGCDSEEEEEEEDEDNCMMSSPSPSSLSNDSTIGPKKQNKKRIRPRRKRKPTGVVPRLFKRDIRRYYASMFANISNTQDYKLFYAFFETYSTRELIIKRHEHQLSYASFPVGTKWHRHFSTACPSIDVNGIAAFVNAVYISSRMHPDHIVTVDDVKVVTRNDTADSKVMYRTHIDFTLMYDIHPVNFMESVFDTVRNNHNNTNDATVVSTPQTPQSQWDDKNDSSSQEEQEATQPKKAPVVTLSTPVRHPPSISQIIDPFDYFEARTGHQMPLLRQPLPLSMSVQTILHINEDRRITMIEMSDLQLDEQ